MKKVKIFPFSDVFEYKRGERITEIEQIPGTIPYISSTKTNNGIDNHISPPDRMTLHEKNKMTLSNSGSVGYLFYHDYQFVASDHVTVIWIKDSSVTLTKNIALFLKPIFESIRYKYNFGREISNTRLVNEHILLPVNDDEPDWDYMEIYIKECRKKINFKYINTSISNYNNIKKEEWSEFNLIDYFDMYAGKYYPATSYSEGEIPLVSASDKNNGIMALTDLDTIFKGNCLTIGKVGMSVFYQEHPFSATSDVTVLIPKEKFNKYIAIFVKTVLIQESYKWSFGRQIRLNDCKKLIIRLPSKICSNNISTPDWDYMEGFIKNLPYCDKITVK